MLSIFYYGWELLYAGGFLGSYINVYFIKTNICPFLTIGTHYSYLPLLSQRRQKTSVPKAGNLLDIGLIRGVMKWSGDGREQAR